MRRWLDQWRISRALDDGRALDGKLARRVERDPALRAYYEQMQALEARLRSEPMPREVLEFDTEATPAHHHARASFASLARIGGAAAVAAAVVLLAFVGWRTAVTPEPSTADLQRARATVENIFDAQAQTWTRRAERTADTVRAPLVEFQSQGRQLFDWIAPVSTLIDPDDDATEDAPPSSPQAAHPHASVSC